MKTLLSISGLMICGLLLSPQIDANTKKGQQPPVQTKEYKVPGSVAISTAKRHGYRFSAWDGKRNNKLQEILGDGCDFKGMHWTIDSKKKCYVNGFNASRKCMKLRKGWKLKDIRLKGSYVWKTRPSNTERPTFQVESNNQSSAAKIVSIDYITLIGPKGKFNKFEEAFSHCSDPNYSSSSRRPNRRN